MLTKLKSGLLSVVKSKKSKISISGSNQNSNLDDNRLSARYYGIREIK